MKLTVGIRLIGVATFAVVMCVGVGLVGLRALSTANTSAKRIADIGLATANHLESDMMHDALRGDVLEAMQATEEKHKSEVAASSKEHGNVFLENFSENAKLDLAPEVESALQAVKPKLDAYLECANTMVDLGLKDPTAAKGKLPEFMACFSDLEEAMAELTDNLNTFSEETLQAQTQSATSTRLSMLGAMVIASLLLAITQAFTMRIIMIPLRLCRDVLALCAKGDLTRRAEWNRKDEFGELASATNTLAQNFGNMIGEVQRSAIEVASAATQIASSANEMSAAVDDVAKQTSRASETAADSGRLATEGGQIVGQTVNGMQQINDAVTASASSVTELGNRGREIGEVIGVINGIADQTNLLALNAAIEAARAGEHGRGFAVVADEVRKLADRTSKATEEVGQSIQAIQRETEQAVHRMQMGTDQVKTGVALASQAGSSLEQIVRGASDVAGMVQSISAAAEEAGAGARQSAEAAAQLSTKAEQLQSLVAQFRIS